MGRVLILLDLTGLAVPAASIGFGVVGMWRFVPDCFSGGAVCSLLFRNVLRRDSASWLDFGNMLYLYEMYIWHDPCNRNNKQHNRSAGVQQVSRKLRRLP